MKNITLTTEQRKALIGLIGLNQDVPDQFGNVIRVQITDWKGQRVYINTIWKGKRDESTYLSLSDNNDLTISFNSDSTADMIMALIDAEVTRMTPDAVESNAEEKKLEADYLGYLAAVGGTTVEELQKEWEGAADFEIDVPDDL